MLGMYGFIKYCYQRNVNPFQATTKTSIEDLTEYFHTGVGFSSINTARSFLFRIIKTENETSFGEMVDL